MDTIRDLLASERTLVIAHAGGNVDAPQETLYAYRCAAEAGSDVLELDVMCTADRALIVHHDDTVDRLSNGTGAVADLTLAQVQAFDAAYWFLPDGAEGHGRPASAYALRGVRTGAVEPPSGATPDDFRVPTFREVAQAFPQLPLDVEIKGSGAPAMAALEVLAAELETLDRIDSTIVVSFESSIVEAMRARLPAVALSPGLDTIANWALGEQRLGDYAAIQVPPTYEGIDVVAVTLGRAHAEGVAVWVWPNEPVQESTEYYQRLIDMGVDGVIAASPRRWPRR